jgi:hypothetical protein
VDHLGDSELLRGIEKAMAGDHATVAMRRWRCDGGDATVAMRRWRCDGGEETGGEGAVRA